MNKKNMPTKSNAIIYVDIISSDIKRKRDFY